MAALQSIADSISQVPPNEDETVEERVFRILGQKILKMLITNERYSSPYFYCRRAVLRYRTVSKAWRDTIHQICVKIGPPLFEYKFYFGRTPTEKLLENVLKLSSLLTSPHASSVVAPLSLDLNLACPPHFSDTKSGILATLFNFLKNMDKMILSLSLNLCHDSLEGTDWSSLKMENLKYLKFSWHGPIILGTALYASCPNVNVPALELPKSLEMLEIDEIKIPMWLVEIAPTFVNLKRLTIRAVSKRTYGLEAADSIETMLIANFANSLEYLKFEEPCRNTEIVIPEPRELPKAFNIVNPIPKLHSLEVDLTHWRIGELEGYKEWLPSLANLTVNGFREDLNFPASWYASPCLTLRRLSICSNINGRNVPPLSDKMLVALSQNFPNLKELKIEANEFQGNNWQAILCQGFPNLSKLAVKCRNVPAEGSNILIAAVCGIPLEELQAILKNEKMLEDAIIKFKHYPSLRDLSNLQELTLDVFNSNEGFNAVKTDTSVMISSTFLQIPTLKLVELNTSFQLTDDLIKQAREKTGLIIRCI